MARGLMGIRLKSSMMALLAYSPGPGSLSLTETSPATNPVTSRKRVSPANPYLQSLKGGENDGLIHKEQQTQPLPASAAATSRDQAGPSVLEPGPGSLELFLSVGGVLSGASQPLGEGLVARDPPQLLGGIHSASHGLGVGILPPCPSLLSQALLPPVFSLSN